MPAIQHLAQAAYSSPVYNLLARNGDSDDDDNDGGIRIIPGGIVAIIVVCVLVLVSVVACCCCCRRRKRRGAVGSSKEDNAGNGNKTDLDPTKYIKKAIKKCMKKIKKMVSKKNKKAKDGATPRQEGSPYGQGTHPGYGQNERSMGYSGGYDRLDGDNEERVALSSAPYGHGARGDH
ncbi:hypothetical protein CSIM01_11457 [Colletotrichum simmondsii]|uniref:Uncharacterized protein n=1 Tax=Colletotrichum simmondsii TaxID=703756 RepID=A0A135RRY2_9PEZI|nr:hypothetical protein CSIM01_11457 [Colletotrichum simmondsii]